MPKILNTNMGLGFIRGRNYDMNLGRLGQMKTAHSELRKTRELNLQSEMRKLKDSVKTYSTRRFSTYPYQVLMTENELRLFSEFLQREFGMGDVVQGVGNGIRDVTGNVVQGAGKVIGSGLGQTVAGVAGAVKGAALGASALMPILPLAPIGAIGGALLGGWAGSKAAEIGGNTLKNIGQDIHT